VETDAADGNPQQNADSHRGLKKPRPLRLLFHSFHKPDGGDSIYLNEVKQTAAYMGSIFQEG